MAPTLTEEVAETLRRVLESYLSAEGDPLDDIRCPELKAAWEALSKSATAQWTMKNCRFARKARVE
jgi:hypothetical protein